MRIMCVTTIVSVILITVQTGCRPAHSPSIDSRPHNSVQIQPLMGEFYEVNVAYIGTDMLVQHYKLVESSKSHIKFYSPNTKAYLYRWLRVTFGVPWEMLLRSVSLDACELSCVIGADFPSRLLAAAAWLNGLGFLFLKRHLADEGWAFAASIGCKFGPERAGNPAWLGAAVELR